MQQRRRLGYKYLPGFYNLHSKLFSFKIKRRHKLPHWVILILGFSDFICNLWSWIFNHQEIGPERGWFTRIDCTSFSAFHAVRNKGKERRRCFCGKLKQAWNMYFLIWFNAYFTSLISERLVLFHQFRSKWFGPFCLMYEQK